MVEVVSALKGRDEWAAKNQVSPALQGREEIGDYTVLVETRQQLAALEAKIQDLMVRL